MKTIIIDGYECQYVVVWGNYGSWTQFYFGYEMVEEAYGFLYLKKREVLVPNKLFSLNLNIESVDVSIEMLTYEIEGVDISAKLNERNAKEEARVAKKKWLTELPLTINTTKSKVL